MNTELQIYIYAIAPFVGAAITFLFIRLAQWLDRYFERKIRHYNALVRLEDDFNRYLGLLSDDKFIIEGIKKGCSVAQKNKHITVMNQVKVVPFERDIIRDLTNIKLINELFSYFEDLRKINADVDSINDQFNRLNEFLSAKVISQDDFIDQLTPYTDNLTLLDGFISDSGERAEDIIKKIRYFINKDKPVFTRFLIWKLGKGYPKNFEDKLVEENQKVSSELKDTWIKDSHRIKRIQRDSKNS